MILMFPERIAKGHWRQLIDLVVAPASQVACQQKLDWAHSEFSHSPYHLKTMKGSALTAQQSLSPQLRFGWRVSKTRLEAEVDKRFRAKAELESRILLYA